MKRFSKLLAVTLILILGSFLAYRLITQSRPVQADWYNDSWAFRNALPISSHTAGETNVYIVATLNIDATANAQANDADIRITKTNGEVLPYYLVSGVGTTAIVAHILIDNFPAGPQTFYYYYGNPNAQPMASQTDFSTVASSYAVGTLGSQEKSPGPLAYWKFDEGQGTTAYDTISNHNLTFGAGNSAPTWTTEDQCVSGKCLQFDGVKDYAKSATTIDLSQTTTVTLEFWLNKNFTNTDGTAIGSQFSANCWNDGSAICIYPDDSVSGKFFVQTNSPVAGPNTTLFTRPSSNAWHHYAIVIDRNASATTVVTPYVDGILVPYTKTQTSSLSGSSFQNYYWYFGASQGNNDFSSGKLDDVKIYPYIRTPAQIKADFNARGNSVNKGSSLNLGSNNRNSDALSQGLVSYWKMDENVGTSALDSSGNNNTAIFGTGTSAPGWISGKFGIGLSFGVNKRYKYKGNNHQSI